MKRVKSSDKCQFHFVSYDFVAAFQLYPLLFSHPEVRVEKLKVKKNKIINYKNHEKFNRTNLLSGCFKAR